MAEKYNEYYRVYFHASGIYSPLLTKRQMLQEIDLSLLHVGKENDLQVTITPTVMTTRQFKERSQDLKHYSGGELSH